MTRAAMAPATKSATTATGEVLQRKCACAGKANSGCKECNKKKIQRKLTIGASNDPLEQEADRVAEQVLSAPAHTAVSATPPRIQRFTGQATSDAGTAPASVDRVLSGSGRPLDPVLQQDMGQRFGYDFSRVRVHTGSAASQSARDVNAYAYTVGNDIVFGAGRFVHSTSEGRRLIAHELTHVVQQGSAPLVQRPTLHEGGPWRGQISEMHVGVTSPIVQRWPGDGMVRPGDCGWVNYFVLRGSVETAKAVVGMLGACSRGETCLTLATKIAAITAEIAARVVLDATCFRGGDTGHREQVQGKINMINRCYWFFDESNCPPALIAAMAVVVETARQVIAAASVAAAIALVAVLIAAIIALADVIAALLAAAAEAAAAVAAIVALLVNIRDSLSPEVATSA